MSVRNLHSYRHAHFMGLPHGDFRIAGDTFLLQRGWRSDERNNLVYNDPFTYLDIEVL